MKGFPNVLGSSLRAFFKRVLPVFPAKDTAAPIAMTAPVVTTQVVNELATIIAPQAATKRFKRNMQEIELGLTIEQAMAARASLPQKVKKARGRPRTVKAEKPVEIKAKRFRRTPAEIEAGLSIEQAAAARGVAVSAPQQPKKIYVERKVEVQPVKTDNLIETLSPRIQLRARAVSSYRAKGHQGVVTSEMLDLVERAVKEGKVTKCEPFVGADGFNHFTQEDAK
jgi:hypothetical protein